MFAERLVQGDDREIRFVHQHLPLLIQDNPEVTVGPNLPSPPPVV
ncbi:hypothetical protein DB31_1488 [Hyalangium minutum]|uniref:Uncharacterized protein n=1 Tax=Hyalangium minutum TaxID=394096 RepID=A0A085WCF9_9BACT|nr:hypothetical protein DB31_1488 [Hyalangium minutum]